ncbi:response regulator [Xanthobacter flavus]|uniref:response regulator n=1 Tax=Xanthobacter flavus TaxID=281 RepID=UPI001AE48CE6|nr:response regulator [Xanthobacter flavus]MBP2149176.1 CheY-like chemotaxis protein/HAMP domain-containing protein [Xanthobacter flavus]
MLEKLTERSWFANLGMQAKAGLIVGLLISMFLLLLGANWVMGQMVKAQERRVEQVRQVSVLAADAIRAFNRRQLETTRTALAEPRNLKARLAASTALTTEMLAALRAAVSGEPTLLPFAERASRISGRWSDAVAAPLLTAAESADLDTIEAALRVFLAAEASEEGYRGIVGAIDELSAAASAEVVSAQVDLDRADAIVSAIDVIALVATLFVAVAGVFLGAVFMAIPLRRLAELMTRLAEQDHTIEVPYAERKDEVGTLARALRVFKATSIAAYDTDWVKTSLNAIGTRLQAQEDTRAFADALLTELAPLLGAGVGVFYAHDETAGPEGEALELVGSYAFSERRHLATRVRLGEGLVGQCALERQTIVLSPVPADHMRIRTGTGEAAAHTVVAVPLVLKKRLLGVVELALLAPMDERARRLLHEVMPLAALSLDNLARAARTRELLEQSQKQAQELRVAEEELRTQQEELRATNEQLHERTLRLAASEEELRVQAEELQASNDVLRRSSQEMTEQKELLEALNQQMEARAEELLRANEYKSQFLANMSHELRTPLNSLLILSQDLAENRTGNLDADQVEAASIIHSSGSNLLRLINDILDLSKVEAGKMEVVREPVKVASVAQRLERNFRRLAQERKLRLSVSVTEAPDLVFTDPGKLDQILTNLVGNALKFTMQGRVSVTFSQDEAGKRLRVAVADSGIGIPEEKLGTIFEAFEQVDASTRRQFGGTGLGLAITQRLAGLLGGSVSVESSLGQGSTFTLEIPVGEPLPDEADGESGTAPSLAPSLPPSLAPSLAPSAGLSPAQVTFDTTRQEREAAGLSGLPPVPAVSVEDDRDRLTPGSTVILVVEDDPVFARTLVGLVRRKGYLALAAGDGESGLALARTYRPTGILLDVMLPGLDGWTVIERLKADAATRHIPVHFVSALDESRRGRDLGAVGFLTKPVSAEQLSEALGLLTHYSADRPRRVLVVDDDAAARHAVRTLLAREKAQIVEAASAEAALEVVAAGDLDCIVLDLGLPGMSGFELIERLAEGDRHVPVVVYSGRDLTTEERMKLRAFTDAIVVKGALSPERLLDEVSLFLHSVQREPEQLAANPDGDLEGRKLLLVDDDMRNIYALAKVLRARGVNVVLAQDGAKALGQLDEQPDIEIVLMDVMMPVMDGYEAMTQIRAQPRFAKLPVIALTAKAMKDDREKCLAAGASDYLAKPVDVPKLLSMIRTWLAAR